MKKDISEMRTEDLLKDKQRLSVMSGTLVVMLFALLVLSIYVSVKKGFSALVAIPFALSSIVIMNYKQINAIKKELESRNG